MKVKLERDSERYEPLITELKKLRDLVTALKYHKQMTSKYTRRIQ